MKCCCLLSGSSFYIVRNHTKAIEFDLHYYQFEILPWTELGKKICLWDIYSHLCRENIVLVQQWCWKHFWNEFNAYGWMCSKKAAEHITREQFPSVREERLLQEWTKTVDGAYSICVDWLVRMFLALQSIKWSMLQLLRLCYMLACSSRTSLMGQISRGLPHLVKTFL